MSDMSKYVKIIDTACEEILACGELLTIMGIWRKLMESCNQDPEDSILLALRDACAYMQDNTGAFSPAMVFPVENQEDKEEQKCKVYPTPLEDIKPDDTRLSVWLKLANDSKMHSIVRSRLADLLWFKKYESANKWYQVATDEYVKLGISQEVGQYERAVCLARTVSLLKEARQPNKVPEVLDVVKAYIQEQMESSDPDNVLGGIATGLKVLITEKGDYDALLQQVVERYGMKKLGDIVCVLKNVNPDEANRLAKKMMKEYEEEASYNTGLRRIHLLEKSWKIAEANCFKDDVLRLTGEIERLNWDNDAITIDETFVVPSSGFEQVIDQVVGDDNLLNALLRYGHIMPPMLTQEMSKQFLDELSKCNSLSTIFPVRVTGPEGSHQTIECNDTAVDDCDRLSIQIHMLLYEHQIVKQIHNKYGLNRLSIRDAFNSVNTYDETLVRNIEVSVERWLAKDYVSATYILGCSIEPAFRQLCVHHKITSTSIRKDTPEVTSLSNLLSRMTEANFFPTDSFDYRYLSLSLTNNDGLNLRNALVHGLKLDLNPWLELDQDNSWGVLFHIFCMLLRYAHFDVIDNTTST